MSKIVKKISLLTLCLIVCFSATACKKTEVKKDDGVPISFENLAEDTVLLGNSREEAEDFSLANLNEDTNTVEEASTNVVISETQSQTKTTANITLIGNDIEFDELTYYSSEGAVFTINNLQEKTEMSNGEVRLDIQATGNISGLSGTYTLLLPYSIGWKKGDRVNVSYKLGLDEEENVAVVIDLAYVSKASYDIIEKQKALKAAEEEHQRLLEEQARLEEEAKKAKEWEARRKAEEQAKIAQQQAQAAQQAAQQAEQDLKQAEQDRLAQALRGLKLQ